MATLAEVNSLLQQAADLQTRGSADLKSILDKMEAIDPKASNAMTQLDFYAQKYDNTKAEYNSQLDPLRASYLAAFNTLSEADKQTSNQSAAAKQIQQNNTLVASNKSRRISIYDTKKSQNQSATTSSTSAPPTTTTTTTTETKAPAINKTTPTPQTTSQKPEGAFAPLETPSSTTTPAPSSTVPITQQDKSLLALLAKGEARDYNTVYGGADEKLVQKTIAEVMEWQAPLGPDKKPNPRKPSTAVGRYQMLYATVEETTKNLKIDRTQTRFTPTVQDVLILNRLETARKYADWKALKLGDSERANSEKFMIELAKEFASVPVPYGISANELGKNLPAKNVAKGQSLYAGDGLNKAHHDPDSFLTALIDIRKAPAGEVTNVPITGGVVGESSAYPAEGTSPLQKMSNFAAGGGFYKRRPGGSLDAKSLPAADSVYTYEVINPLASRYDSRTGKKVADLSAYGTSSVANYNQANSDTATNTPASQPGVAPADKVADPATATPADDKKLMDARDKVATQPGRYSDFKKDANAPAKPVTTSEAPSPTQTPGTTPPKATPTDGLTGTSESNKILPTKETAPPAATNPDQPKPEETNKRDMAVKLETDRERVKRDISSLLRAASNAYSTIPDVWLRELIENRDKAADDLLEAQKAETAAMQSGNQTAIDSAKKAVFVAESKYKSFQDRIAAGKPYGLTTSMQESRAKTDNFYNGIVNKLRAAVDEFMDLGTQATKLGIVLKDTSLTADYSSVPPVVKIS